VELNDSFGAVGSRTRRLGVIECVYESAELELNSIFILPRSSLILVLYYLVEGEREGEGRRSDRHKVAHPAEKNESE